MKTSISNLVTICTVFLSLTAFAQRNHNGNNQSQNPNPNSNSSSDKHLWAYNNGPHIGGGVSIHFGTGGGYYPPNYNYGCYNSYYKIKKAARHSIRQSAHVIGQALAFSDWNDIYSPWLAKAIRHQQYAKQLYFWGDYAGALNHAERAGFLAWNTLNYFNNPYGFSNGGGAYADPYSDPNNPYYRQGNTTTDNNTGEDNTGFKQSNQRTNNSAKSAGATTLAPTEIDNSLPNSKVSDKELLKTKARDLDIE